MHPLVLGLDAGWIATLCGVVHTLKCRDRLERPGGGQHEVALERLARLRVPTGQGERRDKDRMNILDVIRIDRDRPASQFNRLVIALQPEIDPRLAAIPTGERRIVTGSSESPLSKYSRPSSKCPKNTWSQPRLAAASTSDGSRASKASSLGDLLLGSAPGTEGLAPFKS